MADNRDDDDDGKPYTVGYKKPPKNRQWQRGQSGNPKGPKPKLRPEKFEDILRHQLHREITLSDGTKARVVDLIAAQGVKDLAAGKIRQWPQTFDYLSRFDPNEKFVPTADDEKRLKELITRSIDQARKKRAVPEKAEDPVQDKDDGTDGPVEENSSGKDCDTGGSDV